MPRSGDLQNRLCKLCKGAGEITLKREKMYAKLKYHNITIQLQDEGIES